MWKNSSMTFLISTPTMTDGHAGKRPVSKIPNPRFSPRKSRFEIWDRTPDSEPCLGEFAGSRSWDT